jgi:hypothetical protein
VSRRDPFNEGEAAARARKFRSIAMAVGLLVFVALVFVVTLVRIGANVANRPF